MDAVENFSTKLSELEDLVIESSNSAIYQKVEELRNNWTIFSAQHKNLLTKLEQLKTSKARSGRNEELKLITTSPEVSERSYQYESSENLFDHPTNQIQLENSPTEDFGLLMTIDSPSSFSSLPMSPPTTPPMPYATSNYTGTRDMSIVTRNMSIISTSSSSPSLTSGYNSSSSPTFSLNSPDVVISPKTIRQRGHEKKYEMFQEIFHSPILGHVTCFVLSFIQIETPVLFDTLERCPSLNYFECIHVIFMGPFNRHITLPHLKRFTLNCCTSATKRLCESKNLTQDDFQNSLFFANWEMGDPIPLSVTRIELVVDGWTQLKIDYESGEFVSKLTFATDFLDRVKSRFILRRLALQACKFNSNSYDNFQNMKYLNFQSILTSSEDLVKVLQQSENLQELRFKNYIASGIQLKDIPSRRLKFLCLGLCTYTLSIKYSPGVRFENLDTLIFPTNILDTETLKNIPSIFKTKKVVAYLCSAGVRCKCRGHYILHQLLQIESIEYIWMSNFRRKFNNQDDQLELYCDKYEEFLLSAGLTDVTSTSFILEKKEVPMSSLVRVHGKSEDRKLYKWIGRDVRDEEHQVLEFQNRDGFKFSSWEAYTKRY